MMGAFEKTTEAACGRSDSTEVLGCAVDFVDDCKGKRLWRD